MSAAIALNLYEGGNFFTTQTNALLADNKTSDISVVEFPIIYYIVSLFYRIFGFNEFWFRITQVIIGYIGLFYLFKAAYYYTRDWFHAALIPLIVFTAPIYAFYLNNFIPDSVSLSIVFIGFFYFTRYLESRKFRMWLFSMGFLLLAGLIKTSSLMLYFGIGGLAFLEFILNRFSEKSDRIFQFSWKYVASYFGVFILIAAWYIYARIYSDMHPRSISEIEIRPIWAMDHEGVERVVTNIKMFFRNGHYHSRVFLIGSLPIFLTLLFFRRKLDSILYSLSILLFLGGISFTMLFFRSMRSHDYYQINNLMFFVIVFLALFQLLRDSIPRFYKTIWLKLPVLIVAAFLINHARVFMHFGYSEENPYMSHASKNMEMFDIRTYLRSLGIEREDKTYCTPDRSVNISLYLMDQKGFTDFDSIGRWPIEKRIAFMKTLDAEYLVMGTREPYKDVENLDELLGEKIGQTGTTEIFRLIY